MKIIWVVVFTLMVSYAVVGQNKYMDGKLLLNNNDTLYVKVKTSSLAKNECRYTDSLNIEHVADPKIVKGFSLANGKQYFFKHFVSRFDTLDAFFEVIVKGKISLYAYQNRYFAKKNEELLELRNNNQPAFNQDNNEDHAPKNEYIGILRYFLSDSSTNLTDLNHLYYGIDEFVKLARTYNEGDKYIAEMKSKRFKPQYKLGFEAGYQLGTYEFILAGSRIDSRFAIPEFGPILRYQFSNHLSIGTGLNCSYFKFLVYKKNVLAQNVSYFTLDNTMGMITLPVQINYQFYQIPLLPHIGLGSSFEKFFVNNSNYTEELTSLYSDEITTYQHTTQFSANTSVNILMEIGCSLPGNGVQYGLKMMYASQLYGFSDERKDHINPMSALKFAISVLF